MKPLALILALVLPMLLQAADIESLRKRAEALTSDQNWKDALPVQRELILDAANDGPSLAKDIGNALDSHHRLNQSAEADTLIGELLEKRPASPWIHLAAARYFAAADHHGYRIGDRFFRGGLHRQGGTRVFTTERDRTMALRSIDRALALLEKSPPPVEDLADLYLAFADVVTSNRASWQLFTLQPLDPLPDWEEIWSDTSSRGAPVGDDGLPKYHRVPESWAAAKTDGERWRWLLAQAAAAGPKANAQATLALAGFMDAEIGVGTLSGWHRPVRRDHTEPATYAVHTLTDDETLAQLATGPKRFAVPAEFNPIRLLSDVAGRKADPESARAALASLAEIFEQRRQFPRAAAHWKRLIDDFGQTDPEAEPAKHYRQITGNWGRFESHPALPAGRESTVPFSFRNATKVAVSFRKIDLPAIFADLKARLRSNTPDSDDESLADPGDFTSLPEKPALARRFLSPPLSPMEIALEPAENHLDRRIDIKTPVTAPGAYLVEARIADGNTTRTVLWLTDTLIVKKPAANGSLFFVADAATGQPLPRIVLEFLGTRSVERNGKSRLEVKSFAEATDDTGLFLWKSDRSTENYDWMVSAADGRGRFAMLSDDAGYSGSYGGGGDLDATKVFFASDRPAYRPGQPVKWKSWIREVRYDADGSKWAGKSFIVRISDPKGEKLAEKSYKADAYGGIDDAIDLPEGAALGPYRVAIGIPGKKDHPQWIGGGSFRVEEYKKPEFEVTIEAPKVPVGLGEKVTATPLHCPTIQIPCENFPIIAERM